MATKIAIWAYAAYKYDASPAQIAFYGAAFSAPGVVLGPFAGVVIDRVGARPTLLAAKALGVVASIALLSAHDFRMLTVLSAMHGVGQAFARPALSSIPPRLVADEHLARANALVGLTDQLAIVLGPVAAGFAIAAFGFKGAFVFDGLTYLLGIVVLPMVHLSPVPRSETHGEPPNAWREAMAGWRVVRDTPVVRRTVAVTFVVFWLYGTALLAEPLYVRDVLHRSSTVFASLQTVFGIFLVVGGLIATRIGDRMATFGWVAFGAIGSGVSAGLYLGTKSIVVAIIGVAVWGGFTAIIGGPSRTVIQRATPPAVHGRVMAADNMARSVAMFLGLGVAGTAVGPFGVRTVIFVIGTLVVLAGVALSLGDRRAARLELCPPTSISPTVSSVPSKTAT